MATQKLTCPSCDTSLTLKNPVAPGKAVRCPKCQTTFKPPAEAAGAAKPPAAKRLAPADAKPSPKPGKGQPSEGKSRHRDDDEEPRPRRDRSKKAARSPALFWSLIGVTALVVLGGGTVGVLWGLGVFDSKPVAKPPPGTKPGEKPDPSEYKKLIVGRWLPTKAFMGQPELLLREDGTMLAEMEHRGVDLLMPGKYRFLADDRVEFELPHPDGSRKKFEFTVRVTKDELTAEGSEDSMAGGYKRSWTSGPGDVSAALLGTWLPLDSLFGDIRFAKDGRAYGDRFGMGDARYQVVSEGVLEFKDTHRPGPAKLEFRFEDELLVLKEPSGLETSYWRGGVEEIDAEMDPWDQSALRISVRALNCSSILARSGDYNSPTIGLEFGIDNVFKPDADFKQFAALLKGARYLRFVVQHGKPFPWEGIKDLAALPNLKEVRFSFNKAEDDDLKNLSFLDGFKSLDIELWDSKITDFSPLTKLKNLRRLDLTLANMAEKDLREIASIAGLQELTLPGIEAKSETIRELTKLKELSRLNIQALDPTDADVKELMALPKLRALSIDAAKMTDEGVKELAVAANLEELSIDLLQGSTTVAAIGQLASMKQLRKLEIRHAKLLTDETIKELAGLENLWKLEIDQCRELKLDGLKELKSMKQLRILQLSFMGLGESDVAELKKALPRTTVLGN